jgi:hypothetical protein
LELERDGKQPDDHICQRKIRYEEVCHRLKQYYYWKCLMDFLHCHVNE